MDRKGPLRSKLGVVQDQSVSMLVRRRGRPQSPRLPEANVRTLRMTSFSTPERWVRGKMGDGLLPMLIATV